ncbi:cytochrome P450 [Brachybacterium endophyticum]|uniref:Cytochrome P450 n=1 Tax=Brachybacterium endophyticum TaxID=2182385 RepID=A0A2U2RKG7_9MICO|nr:cytochrome P450 [Brachybacterium endophyticum]PWH06336.1 cytochrome P450 [Brachybacterium endophyticum]
MTAPDHTGENEDSEDSEDSRGGGGPGGSRRAVRPHEQGCPVHTELEGARAVRGHRAPRAWRIRSYHGAREVLRRREETTQAGFTSEAIPRGWLRHHPILLSDGPGHDDQRRKVGRFFAPQQVAERSGPTMRRLAERLVGEAVRDGGCDLDDLALLYSVAVTREIVGLTEAPLEAMSRRLVRFMRQPPFDLTRAHWGRTPRQWATAALRGLGPLAAFHLRDVLPAIRRRRREGRDDVITHLLEQGYTRSDVLVECVTYATAGMITTREFIVMACWHLLEDDDLRERFRAGGDEERGAILREIIRLEPVVGHLYRRAHEPFDVEDGPAGAMGVVPGDLLDLCIREANADPEVVGEDPLSLCPHRELPRGAGAAGLSFGAGAHRCPGEHLAITETAVLLGRLFEASPTLLRAPEVSWEDLVAGYRLRGMRLGFPA